MQFLIVYSISVECFLNLEILIVCMVLDPNFHRTWKSQKQRILRSELLQVFFFEFSQFSHDTLVVVSIKDLDEGIEFRSKLKIIRIRMYWRKKSQYDTEVFVRVLHQTKALFGQRPLLRSKNIPNWCMCIYITDKLKKKRE